MESAFLVFNSDDLGFLSLIKGPVSLGMSSHLQFVRLLQISVLKESVLVIARALVVHCNYMVFLGVGGWWFAHDRNTATQSGSRRGKIIKKMDISLN